MSDALNTRNNEILGKSGAMCDKIFGIWQHYCTMMTGLVTGFYKKATSLYESFDKVPLGVCSARAMSNNCAVQQLVREFRERGLQNILSNPPGQSYST